MQAADCDLVDQHERASFPAVDQQGLAGSSQGRREVPEQGGSREPGAEDDHARCADAYATASTLRSGTSLFPSLHPSSSGVYRSGAPLRRDSLQNAPPNVDCTDRLLMGCRRSKGCQENGERPPGG